jgi:hypothetical protein
MLDDALPAAGAPRRATLAVAGASRSGKTTLVRRLAEGALVAPVAPTVGVDFGVLPLARRGGAPAPLRLDVFDLSGAPAYAPLRADLLKEPHVLLLVFDVGAAATFAALGGALQEARAAAAAAGAPPPPPELVVVGASAAAAPRAVADADARAWARAAGAAYVEVCARSGAGVDEALDALAAAAARALDARAPP